MLYVVGVIIKAYHITLQEAIIKFRLCARGLFFLVSVLPLLGISVAMPGSMQ